MESAILPDPQARKCSAYGASSRERGEEQTATRGYGKGDQGVIQHVTILPRP
jgi:hypothetical protein